MHFLGLNFSWSSLRSLFPGLFKSLDSTLSSYSDLPDTHYADPGLSSINSPKIPSTKCLCSVNSLQRFWSWYGASLCVMPSTGWFSSAQFSLSHVQLFATPWIAARQATLSITIFQSSLKLTSIKSVMPSSHLILCLPLFLLPPIPPSIRVKV